MTDHKACQERIQELEDQLTDALVTIDDLYDENDRQKTTIMVLKGLLAESRKDHRSPHNPESIA